MSAGFPSKADETTYSRNLAHLLQLVQVHLLKHLTGTDLDVLRWTKQFATVFHTLQRLEKTKFEHPKYSVYCTELADYFGLCSGQSRSQSKTSLRHDFDVTFIQDTYSDRSTRKPLKSVRESQSHRKFVLSNTPPLKKPSVLEPRYYKQPITTSSPIVERKARHVPLCRRLRQQDSMRRQRKSPSVRNSNPYQIYHNRAMWKLNDDLVTYV